MSIERGRVHNAPPELLDLSDLWALLKCTAMTSCIKQVRSQHLVCKETSLGPCARALSVHDILAPVLHPLYTFTVSNEASCLQDSEKEELMSTSVFISWTMGLCDSTCRVLDRLGSIFCMAYGPGEGAGGRESLFCYLDIGP